MKKILILSLFMALTCFVQAQIKTPAPSPKAMTMQTIGLTDVTVEYSRPSVKGRTIFAADGLVPYGKVWRTGANQATKVTFSNDVKVNDQMLKAGSYAITTVPERQSWMVHFPPYKKSSWSSYAEATPAISVKANTGSTAQAKESFSIGFDALTDGGANMMFAWDKTYATLKIGANADEAVMASIDKVLAGPTPNDYYAAGSYYHASGKDLNKALEYVQMATNTDKPKFWQVRKESLILADLGRIPEAVKAANKSLQLAEAAGNADYVKLNKESIGVWSKKGGMTK